VFELTSEFWIFLAVGFAAQIVDGALGMAYGTLSSSILLAMGVPPATASASVHSAQFFTTGLSALSHSYFKNVKWRLCFILALAGTLGGCIGAFFLTSVDGALIKPWIALYLLILGLNILWKVYKRAYEEADKAKVEKSNERMRSVKFLGPLGFFGGLFDSIGGGGWGPIVTSNLLAKGKSPRFAIGSVNTAEFFVKTSIAASFMVMMDFEFHTVVLGLLVGGVIAAPFGALILRFIKPEALMTLVGFLITGLSILQLYGAFFK
jgi:uncharacterized membrane protein YfcA